MDGLNLPEGYIESLADQLGNELQDFLRTYEQPYVRGLRFHKSPRSGFPPKDIKGLIPWEETGRYLDNASSLGSSILHEAGCFYIQEPSAMAPAAVLNPEPGEWVLDLCAAPGGKATQLAARLNGKGLLVANEPVFKRAQILSQNLERMGITNSMVVSALPDQLAAKWSNLFDKILVDAPCSGEGMFRRHPETRLEWNMDSPGRCAARQKEILNSAIAMLKEGGLLCYSTCTLNTVENENVCLWVEKTHEEMALKPFHLPGGINGENGMCHIWPHRIKGEGHFVALFQKDSSKGKPGLNQGLAPAPKEKTDFPMPVQPTGLFGDTLVYLPDYPAINGVKVLRAGLHLGQQRGKVFVPDHALAMAQTPPFQMETALLDANQSSVFLRGETLPGDGRGWKLAVYDGLALGFVKASDGQLKNHYPKGLRKNGLTGQ